MVIIVDKAQNVIVLEEIVKIFSGFTLNKSNYVFEADEIKFRSLLIMADGVRQDPKVEALDHLTTPNKQGELVGFLCMIQCLADFIPEFSEKAALLRALTKNYIKFKWEKKHGSCFRDLLHSFKKYLLLSYFDDHLQTFIITDGHQIGFDAILAQGESFKDAKPVAIASRSTSATE